MKSPDLSPPEVRTGREWQNWTLFCIAIFLIKLCVFALDPIPKVYMGDSGSYVYTALSGWIPEDRSYLYGYLIRWTSLASGSLTSLLLFQLLASVITAILFAVVCRFVFRLSNYWSYVAGIACALDPLQLLYERYVMAEAFSLCLYAAALHQALLYLRDRRLVNLIACQVISVGVIALRMSFLLLVQLDTLVLPLIAFAALLWRDLRGKGTDGGSRWSRLGSLGIHLATSVVLMFVLHAGYKKLTGRLAQREPAYLHASGFSLLAAFSPILQPEDSPDPGLADIISHGDDFQLREFYLRNSQHFSPGRLIDKLATLYPDPATADSLARSTALRALRRDPFGVASLAWQTYAIYWNIDTMKDCAVKDFSFNNPPSDDLLLQLRTYFHLALNRDDTTLTLLQRYYVAAWPYYFLILVAPLLAGLVVLVRFGREYAALLFIHVGSMSAVTMEFGGDSVRYFQPISYAFLLVMVLGLRWWSARVRRQA